MTDPAAVLDQLDELIRRGRHLRTLAGNGAQLSREAARAWQRDCGVVVNELSGGSKAHWLARAFSEAFLVRSTPERVVEEVDARQILDRLLEVLDHARRSIVQAGGLVAAPAETEARVRRFEFVHRRELRPILEQAYADSRRAFERGEYGVALMMSCSVLEAIVTDALEHRGASASAAHDAPEGAIADWPFAARVAAAERAGFIRGGCARLPDVAWAYRDLADAGGVPRDDVTVSERDARVAGQVLNVILRDLDPGR